MFSRPAPVINYLQPRWTAPISFENGATYRLWSLSNPLVYNLVALLLMTLIPPTSSAAAATSTTLAACPVQSCVSSYSPLTDYFPIKAPSSPPDWTVYYFPSYRLVFNNLSTGAETYLLYKCGTPQPSLNASSAVVIDPSIASLVTNATKVFATPVTSVGIDSSEGSVAVTFLELLGERSAIRYLDTTYVTSPCVDALSLQGNITKRSFNASTAGLVQLLIEGNSPTGYANGVSLAASADLTVFRRAGWLKLLSLFFDKEEAALGLYNDMALNYHELQYPAVTSSPIIAWVSASSASLTITRSPYRDGLTTDASAIPYAGVAATTTYARANVSAFKAALQGVQVLVDESYFSPLPTNYSLVLANLGFTAADLSSPLYPFLTAQAVWRDDARDSYTGTGDDWFESADAEPDAVLADFLRLVANFTVTPPYTPWPQLYFRNIALGQGYVEVPLNCSDPSAPALPMLSYWGVSASSLPVITCPPYLSDASLFGGGRSLSGCPVLSCVAAGAFNASVDYFPVKDASYAAEWSVAYFPSYKFVQNNASGETYLLYQCGTPLPTLRSTPGFNASTMVALDPSIAGLVTSGTKAFSVPVKRVAIDDSLGSVGVTYLELLGVRSAIAYLNTAYSVSSPCTDYLASLDVIEALPYVPGTYTIATPDADLILEGNLASSFPQGVSVAATSAQDDLLGYASWLKLIALFFNKEATAALLFNATAANIRSLTAQVAAVTAAKKTVAWVSYNSYSSSPWSIEDSVFRRALVADAGALYLPGASFATAAAFKAALTSVDVLVDETYYAVPPTNTSLVLATLGFTAADISGTAYRFIANASVWRVDARVGPEDADDWYETAVAEPDAVLADFLRLVQPTVPTFLSAASPRYLWFRDVSKGEPATVLPAYTTCADPSAPVLPLWSFVNVTLSSLPAYTCPAFLTNPTQTAGIGSQTLYNLSSAAAAGSSSGGSAGSSSSSSTGITSTSTGNTRANSSGSSSVSSTGSTTPTTGSSSISSTIRTTSSSSSAIGTISSSSSSGAPSTQPSTGAPAAANAAVSEAQVGWLVVAVAGLAVLLA